MADREKRAESGFSAARLERVFNDCFAADFRTLLCGGATEPIYQPAPSSGQFHMLRYREDFFASALHEAAHWCIAGEVRRQEVDFGYWYAPDGRNAAQQSAFEAVEDKPQALEWYFSQACGYPFRLSTDNLAACNGELPDHGAFRHRVCSQALRWQRAGLPGRADRFYHALCAEFDTNLSISELRFCEELLL